MKRPKSGFYHNHIYQNKIKLNSNPSTKRRKLIQSMSERCFCSKDKFNQIFSKNISDANYNEECKVKNVDIKFNIYNNLKKFNNIFNINSYRKRIKNQENRPTSSEYKIKLLKNHSNIPILLLNNNKTKFKKIYFSDKIENNKENENKQIQLDIHSYFPEDFSLNIYKSTSLYKNRYQIETCRLKKALKNIYHEENSTKNKNLNDMIKKNTIENNKSIAMLKLLKSRKIDRFVNRLLNKSPSEKNENSKENNKKIDKIFITNKNKISNESDGFGFDKKNRIINKFKPPFSKCIINYNENKKSDSYNNCNENINNKNNTINSATQTINENKSNNIHYLQYINEYEQKSLRHQNSQIILNKKLSNINKYNQHKNYNYKEIKFEMIDLPKNNFLKNQEKMIRPFSASKLNKLNLNIQNNNDFNYNSFNKKRKLIFSLYEPNDKYIQLFEELEKKQLDYSNNNINNRYCK